MAHVDSAPGASLHLDSAGGRWVLAATVLGSGMAMLDATVVNLALPRIAEDLDASFSQLQWVVNGYTLSLAALILLGGSLGDRMGRRRIFVTGAMWFTVASVLCAAAPTVGVAHRRPRHPGDRRRPADTWEPGDHPVVVRGGGPRHARSVPGPVSAASPRGSGRSSAAGSST